MISGQVYEELYEILYNMDKLTVMKIPEKILLKIKENRDKEYITKIDKNDIFNFENISEETARILAWLDYNYCMEENDKEQLKKDYNKYKENINNQKQKKYEAENIFKTKTRQEEKNESISIIQYKKSVFTILVKKIKSFFNNKK